MLLLQGFAQDYSTDKMRFKVNVTNSKIVFESSYEGLGHPVPSYVYFTPLVKLNRVLLYYMSLSFRLGTLKLPVSDALKMIKRSTNLPDYRNRQQEGKVTLNIQSMKNEKG